jgi:hypothetical protein
MPMVKREAVVPMSACPGCGVVLPGPSEAWSARSTASTACHMLYGEALGYEHAHVVQLGRWHQLLVDTYAAQHVGDETAPITTAFSLVGLYLTLEHGNSGVEVRDAHQLLARRHRDWPSFAIPAEQAAVTVQDLVLTGTPDEYVEVLHSWAGAVWWRWRDEHSRVAALVTERLPPLDRMDKREAAGRGAA